MKNHLSFLGCLLALGSGLVLADQVLTDQIGDTIVAGPAAHGAVNIVPNWPLRGLVYSNSGDLADPFKITRAGGQCETLGDATDLQDNLELTDFGYGCQIAVQNALADDFVLADWVALEELVFYVYQAGATAPTVDRIDYAVLAASPLGQSQPVWTTVTAPPVSFVSVYKKLATQTPDDPNGCTRRLQRVSVTLNPPVTLPAGQYWLAWRLSGTGGNGPWSPPVVIPGATNKPGANAMQSAAGTPFALVWDGVFPQDFVFEVYGSPAGPQPPGACCLITGACVPDIPESVCVTLMGGVWQGPGSVCETDTCPPAQGACCNSAGGCTFTMQADCGGTWLGGGVLCEPNPCPQPGADCQNPLVVTLATPYADANTTCGKLNDYSNTCLGSYDGGEDIIYELVVPIAMVVDVTVTGTDPNNNWIGVLVDDSCPPDATACLYSSNSGAGYIAALGGVNLAAGVYYLMIDSYPAPYCIDYTLTITDTPGACCWIDGACRAGVTGSDCTVQGGAFQGSGTDCGVWAYNAAACSQAFLDISATGTPVALGDDDGVRVPLGFTFDFFGLPKTQVAICSNGYLCFAPTGWNVRADEAIPNALPPNDLVAVLWDDLNCTGRSVHYQTFGTAPNRYFVAQWKDIPQYNGTDENTFQVFLYEADGCIELRYGEFATIDFHAGVENSTGTIGLDVTALVVPNGCLQICGAPPPSPCAGCRGDCNCDGEVNFDDINPFVAILGGGQPCSPYNADVNGDGVINFDDINPFVEALSSGSAGCP